MVVFPNAKINIGLNIISKREDGYHNIESCFYPIDFCDILEVLPAEKFSFTSTGIPIPGSSNENLCLKAYELIKADFDIPTVQIHLHKIIPIGAGLGGGSSDASFTLKALNSLFELSLTEEQLENYAAELGSDCPFFIHNKPTLATGTGTTFQNIELDLSSYHIALVYPDIHVSTKEAYSGVMPKATDQPLIKLLSEPIDTWKGIVKNDFEQSVFSQYPTIEKAKQDLYTKGAIYASMTGSGSTVYGFFENHIEDDQNLIWTRTL